MDVDTDSPSQAPPPTSPSARPSLKQRLQALIAEYGRVAITLYFGIFFLVLGSFAVAFALGVKQVEGESPKAAGTFGIFTAAYLATKLTQPLRIGATLVLTPVVARFVGRFSRRAPGRP